MTFIKTITLLFVFSPFKFFAQSDTLQQPELTNTNVSCFYVIDKIWTDKTSAYKRDADGILNFIQIEAGEIVAAATNSKTKFNFSGKIDSVEICLVDNRNTLRLHSRLYNDKMNSGYAFEIFQREEEVIVHYYPKHVLKDSYFLVHNATAAEIAEIRKYITENTPKY